MSNTPPVNYSTLSSRIDKIVSIVGRIQGIQSDDSYTIATTDSQTVHIQGGSPVDQRNHQFTAGEIVEITGLYDGQYIKPYKVSGYHPSFGMLVMH